MRERRLLTRDDEGSAPVEFVFAALFTTFLLLAVIEVAFALYGRNVLASSAHEAARAAIELGADPAGAEELARSTVQRATGALVSSYEVDVSAARSDDRVTFSVRVAGRLDPPGPLPFEIPVDLTATATRETTP
jgi:Flp pilus assembly protein TadG